MKDLKHYLSLMALLSFGFFFFWLFNYNRQAQIGVTLAIGAAYVLWGAVHHTIKNDFHWRLVLEYAAVAVFASTVVIFLLLRT